MPVMAVFILDQQQRDKAVALNKAPFAVEPRLIDNPLANNLGIGTLVGQFMLPARILNKPEMNAWWPLLGSMPIRTLDMDVLFQPDPDSL